MVVDVVVLEVDDGFIVVVVFVVEVLLDSLLM